MIYENNITSADVSPRGKRERSHIHYIKALNGLVNYFDAPDSTVEFIEACIALHGYDSDDFWIATGEDLARALAPASTVAQIDRIIDRLSKQRKRLSDWQNGRDVNGLSRPILVSIRSEYRENEKRFHYSYSLPIAGLIRQVDAAAPVGSRERKLKAAIAGIAKEYLLTTGLRPPSRVARRVHSPESQVKRGLNCLLSGSEKMSENDFAEMVENAIFENPKLLKIFELANLTIGNIPTDFSTDLTPNMAYQNHVQRYAIKSENGAAGAGAGATWHSGEDDEFEDEPPYFADRFDEVAR